MTCLCGESRDRHTDGNGFCPETGCFEFRVVAPPNAEQAFDAVCKEMMALYYLQGTTQTVQ